MFAKKTILYILLAVLFFTPAVPVFAVAPYEIITYAAINTCKSGATLNGYVNPFFSTDTTRWFEWGASEGSLLNQTVATRNGSNTEYFAQDISGLVPNTTYYFRAVAQNSKGLARGSVFVFKTAGNVPCATSVDTPTSSVPPTTGNPYNSQSVITKPATNMVDTGAVLNAVVLPVGSVQTYGWFEWGSTPNLGYASVRRYLGVGNALPFDELLSGLTPGTTYFFKPVAENQNGTFEGALFSFHTTGMTPAGTPVSNNQNTTAPITKKPAQSQVAAVVMSNNQKEITVEVIPNTDTVAPKERFNETVRLENTTGSTLKEVTVRVIVPCDVVYVSTGGDTFLQTGQMLTHKVGDVKPGEKVSLLFWMDAGANIADKTPLETIAVADWQDKIHPNGTQSVGRAVVTVDKNRVAVKGDAAIAGAAKSTSSFFPTSFRDWGAVIGILFMLFAAYMVFLVMRGRGKEEVLEEAGGSFEDEPTHPALSRAGAPERISLKDPFVSDSNIQKSKTVIPLVPLKKAVTEKGAPPDNLPI